MKTRSLLTSALLLLPVGVFAHPGHGDHDFGWDFEAQAQHLVFDHYYWVLAAVVVGVAAYLYRGRRSRN